MRASIFHLTALLAIAALVAPPSSAEDGRPDLERGARLYSENCARCHNARGPGEFSDLHWPLIITHMRVIAGLPGDQARAIEQFLVATNNPPRRRLAALKPGAVPSGQELIQRDGCRGCHVIGGSGGAIGPKLDDVFKRRSVDWVRTQIQEPRERNPKTVMPELGLTNAEVTAIIEALRDMQK